MLSTYLLEKKIREDVSCKLQDAKWENIFFQEEIEGQAEGTYVFSSSNKYCIVFFEKGKVQERIITTEYEEVLWHVLKICSFDISLEYAKKNRIGGEDFRHALFQKELQIFSSFGDKFSERRRAEIDETLRQYPYNDI